MRIFVHIQHYHLRDACALLVLGAARVHAIDISPLRVDELIECKSGTRATDYVARAGYLLQEPI